MKKEYEEQLYSLLSDIWEYSETAFEEKQSCERMVRFLKEQGFEVTTPVADMDTAYVGVYGSGKPVICFLAEYDALHGMSQEADVCAYQPKKEREQGHGCGHHLLGTGAIGAALLYRDYLKESGKSGTVKIVGCPAEESGSGKAYLAREGFFDDADVALTWHPSNYHMVETGSSQACIQVYFDFHGVSSHAAAAPHLGRSALDAVEIMDVGANYLREHIEPTERLHYAIINSGGESPNVVQAEARVKYLIRSTSAVKVKKLYERVCDVAKGAALITGTKVDILFDEGLYDTMPNFALEDVLKESYLKIGIPEYTKEEREYAKKFKDSFNQEELFSNLPTAVADIMALKDNIENSELCDIFVDRIHSEECTPGSTDVGDVSWVVPTAQIRVNCYSYGAGSHSWQWTGQGKSSIALKGAEMAAEVLADAAKTLTEKPELIQKARAEFDKRMRGQKYECLIPADVKPHLI